MLWYLLYPFRGTTNAPTLAPNHPLRRALARYAVQVAQNVATTLLISVAVTAALLYPIPFLYTSDFASGASSLPRHVWTTAQPIKGGLAVEPDVIMRSIWLHGDYMQALDRDVLLRALDVQDELLGPSKNFDPRRPHPDHSQLPPEAGPTVDLTPAQRDALHVVNGLTNQSWFFHSPLLYWADDRDALAADPDILATVNAHKEQPTSVNITLRHSVVFSGKRFKDRALVAADALVITLIHLRDSPVGAQWARKMAHLPDHITEQWDVYPRETAEARVLPSQLYEFRFLPISRQDSFLLAFGYAATALYLVQNLGKLPAIKSRPGLILTVVVQIVASVLSSFTVCALLNIDLSRIPRAAYPFVVMAMSLENGLRLVKGVIATKPEASTSTRIGEAFGQTTPTALVSVLEHLVLLWGISHLVSEGLSDLCVFIAISIGFDFFYLSTFFLSVLSVEVRRAELGEMLDKATLARRSLLPRPSSSFESIYRPVAASLPTAQQRTLQQLVPERQPWLVAMRQGRMDLSTRIAGTIILLAFFAVAQWHVFGDESTAHTVRRLLTRAGMGGSGSRGSGSSSGGSALVANNLTTWQSASAYFEEVHQARSPTSWLRLQDHDTAREVIHVVKPWAHSYVARVYEPLVLVLRGADRMLSVTERPFLPAVYDFVRHQGMTFVLALLVVTAVMRILVNYLLWDELGEAAAAASGNASDTPRLSIKTLSHGHTLDIALMTASSDGLVVTVGLDRRVCVWNVPFSDLSYRLTNPPASRDVPFPVLGLAISDDSTRLAILSADRVLLWKLDVKQWGPLVAVDLCGRRPEAFFFMPNQKNPLLHTLVIVRHNGTLVELSAETNEPTDHLICKSPIVSAIPLPYYECNPGPNTSHNTTAFALLTASRNGCLHRLVPVGGRWLSEGVGRDCSRMRDKEEKVQELVALPPIFGAYLVIRPHVVDVVDFASSKTIHTFALVARVRLRSLRVLYAARRRSLRDAVHLRFLSLAYTSAETGHCVVQTYLPPSEEVASIAFSANGPSADGRSCTWDEARLVTKQVPNPGVWEALPTGCIIGVRQQQPQQQQQKIAAPLAGATETLQGPGGANIATGLDIGSSSAGFGMGTFRRRVSAHYCRLSRKDVAAATPATAIPPSADALGGWEVWTICNVASSSSETPSAGTEHDSSGGPSPGGFAGSTVSTKDKNYMTHPLEVDADELLATEPGPIACVGAGTIALGLGAAVKIITVGHERFGSPADMLEAAAGLIMEAGNRRRKHHRPNRAGT